MDANQDHELRYIIPNHLSKRLQSLHIHTVNTGWHQDIPRPTRSWKEHDYSQLQELCASGIDSHELRDILRTATNLKRLHFAPNPGVLMSFTESEELIKTALSREAVECLSITSNCLMESIVQVAGILSDKEREIPKRRCFKLRLTTTDKIVACEHQEKFKQIVESRNTFAVLGVLVHLLEGLVTNDFMLYMQFRLDSMFGERICNELKMWKESEGIERFKKYQIHLSTNTKGGYEDESGIYEEFEQITFALCNKNNTMGGYKFTQIWNMPCTHLDEIA
eukprot:224632_1